MIVSGSNATLLSAELATLIAGRYVTLQDRRLLQVNRKHYLGDIGLRNGIVGYRESDIGGVLENLVFLELRRRGYTVTVGVAGSREIDFVAERRSGRRCVQVAYLLESPAPSSASSRPLPRFETRIPGCCSRSTRTNRSTSAV